MCGRFSMGVPGEAVPDDHAPRYNAAPTQPVLAMIEDGRGRRAGWLRWGLLPPWAEAPASGSRMINARAETVAETPAFRAAFRDRRCLVVADGLYEWKKEATGKEPHTRDAAPGIAHIHPRMPVILPNRARDRWLDADADPAELQALALETEPPTLTDRVVSHRVNNVRHDDPTCGAPGEEDGAERVS